MDLKTFGKSLMRIIMVAILFFLVLPTANAALVSHDRYKIEKGDTLWGIAQTFGTTTEKLMQLNKKRITDPKLIYYDRTIRLPHRSWVKAQARTTVEQKTVVRSSSASQMQSASVITAEPAASASATKVEAVAPSVDVSKPASGAKRIDVVGSTSNTVVATVDPTSTLVKKNTGEKLSFVPVNGTDFIPAPIGLTHETVDRGAGIKSPTPPPEMFPGYVNNGLAWRSPPRPPGEPIVLVRYIPDRTSETYRTEKLWSQIFPGYVPIYGYE